MATWLGLGHFLIQLLSGKLCGVQGLNTVVVDSLVGRSRNSNHPHHGLRRPLAGLVGSQDVFLDQAVLASVLEYRVPPPQVLLLVGVDLFGEGGGPTSEVLEIGAGLKGYGRQCFLRKFFPRDGDPKLLAQVFDHGGGRQQVSHNHLPEPGAAVADVVDPGQRPENAPGHLVAHVEHRLPHEQRHGLEEVHLAQQGVQVPVEAVTEAQLRVVQHLVLALLRLLGDPAR